MYGSSVNTQYGTHPRSNNSLQEKTLSNTALLSPTIQNKTERMMRVSNNPIKYNHQYIYHGSTDAEPEPWKSVNFNKYENFNDLKTNNKNRVPIESSRE